MKIIKYIFLLLLLAFIAISVFVATQKGDFIITKSSIINVPRAMIFNYMNDYRNWENWSAWKEDDPDMTFFYPEKTIGNGAYYTWNGKDGSGKTTTVFVKDNDSIAQKVEYSDYEYQSYITFKDTVGGTKVKWVSKGRVNFMTKVYATFTGGIDKLMGVVFERSLNNLNVVVSREANSFNVKVNGVVEKLGGFYIKQTVACKNSEMQEQLQTTLFKLTNFFKTNKMVMNGKPFVMYETKTKDSIRFSICGPLREEILIAPESDVSTGFLESFSALKTTLIGDYIHQSKARKEALDYFIKNKLEPSVTIKDIDVFIKNASDVKNPSQWETEILIPIKAKIVVPKPVFIPKAVIVPEVSKDSV